MLTLMDINSSGSKKVAKHHKFFNKYTDRKNGPRSVSSIECSKNSRNLCTSILFRLRHSKLKCSITNQAFEEPIVEIF